MSRSPRQKGRKRRPKTQPSQGDTVLIGFLGGQNLPDVATRAGEEPLNSASQSETDEWTEKMELDDGATTTKKSHLIQAAQDALSVDGNDDKAETAALETTKRVRPKITTQLATPTSRDHDRRVQLRTQGRQERQSVTSVVEAENLDPALGGSIDANQQQGVSPPVAEERQSSSDIHRSSPLATSPRLRQFMASNGSETLPAIQSATPSLSAKSPNSGQSLPSISAQLGELVDGPSPNDGLPSRSTFPMANGIQSPPMSGISPRPNHYPSPQTRLNSFPTPYPAAQPSPASTYSEVSPREPYRMSHDPTSMSPPGKPGPPYYTTSRPLHTEETTPQSAESQTGFKPFSPNDDQPHIETGRPILPPLPGTGPLSTGNFRCSFPGCTAAAFQTQYLLNSHANVHSQNRPHYCPVKTCPRSEGGKGFKRKNEMIRHGLVHQSPGYICPFCPEREHKYPRPDNLQRHVRANHADKDMNDPQLRDVLAQRSEGGARGRRRRFGGP